METNNNILKINYNNDDFNLENDLNNGQVYCIKNTINNKNYIGQATCFTGNNNNKWGSLGRWKSHIREALKNNDNHCVLLNNAIRKYKPESFEIITLIKCKLDELNEYEIKFIKEFNSIAPNGYNLKTGGDKGKDSIETIIKKQIAHLGVRRNGYTRKYAEDNDLPKYIKSHREDGILKAYVISKFPIGIESKEYVKDAYFRLTKYETKESALNESIIFLDNLKEKYKHINEEIFKEKSIIKPVFSYDEKKEQIISSKLPEYIYAIIKENKIYGYYVEGILNNNNIPYPKREFIGKTNRWNLNDAIKYIEQLNYYTKHLIDVTCFDTIDVVSKNNKNMHENYHLPKYVNIYNVKGQMKGFVINGYPCKDYKCGKYKKEFANKDLTPEENYKNCIKHLEEFKLKNPIN